MITEIFISHYSFPENIKATKEQFVKLDTEITWAKGENTFLEICN